jgi:Na+-driven multidrug efflux pump
VLAIGLPAGGELVLMFIYTATVYYTIRGFGAAAQAGFGIGARVLQAIMLPAMAVAFAAGPIAGQNFGAKNRDRVTRTFAAAAAIGCVVMIAITVLAKWRPELMIGAFTRDTAALAVGTLFLQLVSWNFVAQGLIFTCSSMFQGLGNTRPALLSSATRLITFAIPAVWLSTQPGFRIEEVWYLSVATVALQALVSLWLLRLELRKRLAPLTAAAPLAS